MRKLITAIAFGAALIAVPAIAAETPSTGGSQDQSTGAASQKNAPHNATTHDNKENGKDTMKK